MSDSLRPHESQLARPPCPSPTPARSLLKLMSIEWVMPSNHLILCCLLLLPPPILPNIRIFSMRWFFASCGQSIEVSASASVLPMNIHDWFPSGWTGFDLAVQWTLKSLLQHHNSKASICQHLAFFFREGNGIPLQYSCLENPMDRGFC